MQKLFLNKAFIAAFLVTSAFAVLVWLGIGLVMRFVVRAPIVPPFAGIFSQDPQDLPAFDVAIPHPDDAWLLDGLDLHLLESLERRPYFFTFLIFGMDSGLNTDTIMVAAYDVPQARAYIISIPRDTRVDVARNVRRINSAYPVGRMGGGGHIGGVNQLKREVQTLIGFRPDFYISIEEDAFVRVVDALGGVYVDVPFHMIYDDPWQNLHINLSPGRQRLDGERALHFARYRIGNDRTQTISDHVRMRHQQQLVGAILDEITGPRLLANLPELVRTYFAHVSTDLSLTEIMWFVSQVMRGDAITLETLNYPTTSQLLQRWYDIPDPNVALEIINRTINPFQSDIPRALLRIAQ